MEGGGRDDCGTAANEGEGEVPIKVNRRSGGKRLWAAKETVEATRKGQGDGPFGGVDVIRELSNPFLTRQLPRIDTTVSTYTLSTKAEDSIYNDNAPSWEIACTLLPSKIQISHSCRMQLHNQRRTSPTSIPSLSWVPNSSNRRRRCRTATTTNDGVAALVRAAMREERWREGDVADVAATTREKARWREGDVSDGGSRCCQRRQRRQRRRTKSKEMEVNGRVQKLCNFSQDSPPNVSQHCGKSRKALGKPALARELDFRSAQHAAQALTGIQLIPHNAAGHLEVSPAKSCTAFELFH